MSVRTAILNRTSIRLLAAWTCNAVERRLVEHIGHFNDSVIRLENGGHATKTNAPSKKVSDFGISLSSRTHGMVITASSCRE